MFDTIAGLPVHALVVHAVVVLVPLAVIGTVAVAVVPRWSRRYGWLVVLCSAVATGCAFVAKESGEQLASRVGTPQDHYSAARWLPWVVLALFVADLLLWWWDRAVLGGSGSSDRAVLGRTGPGRHEGRARLRRSAGGTFLAVVAVLVALVALGWTIRAGDTGARAVWGPIVENTTPGTQPVG